MPTPSILPGLTGPADLRRLTEAELEQLAAEIRQTIIAKEKGVTLVLGTPADDGTFHWSDSYALAVDAPNAGNAYAYLDFMTSAESNAALAMELGSGASVEKAYDLLTPTAKALSDYDTVRQPGGGILGTETVVPPQIAEGDIVAAAAWVEAWQTFKAS